ncbi:MAG: hypothetical protein AAF745_05195 [Planctomycetota bacterium]
MQTDSHHTQSASTLGSRWPRRCCVFGVIGVCGIGGFAAIAQSFLYHWLRFWNDLRLEAPDALFLACVVTPLLGVQWFAALMPMFWRQPLLFRIAGMGTIGCALHQLEISILRRQGSLTPIRVFWEVDVLVAIGALLAGVALTDRFDSRLAVPFRCHAEPPKATLASRSSIQFWLRWMTLIAFAFAAIRITNQTLGTTVVLFALGAVGIGLVKLRLASLAIDPAMRWRARVMGCGAGWCFHFLLFWMMASSVRELATVTRSEVITWTFAASMATVSYWLATKVPILWLQACRWQWDQADNE